MGHEIDNGTTRQATFEIWKNFAQTNKAQLLQSSSNQPEFLPPDLAEIIGSILSPIPHFPVAKLKQPDVLQIIKQSSNRSATGDARTYSDDDLVQDALHKFMGLWAGLGKEGWEFHLRLVHIINKCLEGNSEATIGDLQKIPTENFGTRRVTRETTERVVLSYSSRLRGSLEERRRSFRRCFPFVEETQ